MVDQLTKDLEKIGLSVNEAKVYLAALALRESTAQMIAAKATVTRPTTYIAIESLIQRGLMSSFQKGKKRYFAAGAPTQLAYILQNQKKEILERERVVEDLVKRLKNVGGADDRPRARVFEGVDGIRAAQEDMLDTDTDELLQVYAPVDGGGEPSIFEGDLTEKLFKKFKKVRQLTVEAKKIAATGKKRTNLEVRTFPGSHPVLKGELVIYGDKVSMTSYHEGDPTTVLIQDVNMATTFRALFMSAWEKG